MSKKENQISNKITYEKALTRLQEILEDLQEEKISVDELSKRLKEAYQLISLCHRKIKEVKIEIKKIDKEFEKEE